VEAAELKKKYLLQPHQEDLIEEIFTFFNAHLPCPPYSKKKWSINAISWFKDSAHVFISKMRELQAILEQNDLNIRVLKTDKPGMILYEDNFQIVAQNRIH
jgi:hypothetical protein